MDTGTFAGIGDETAFHQNAWFFDPGDDVEAGAFDATVYAAQFVESVGMHSCGQSDVFRVTLIATAVAHIATFQIVVGIGSALRGQSEGFKPDGAAAAEGVEVDADEDAGWCVVGDGNPFPERKKYVGAAG